MKNFVFDLQRFYAPTFKVYGWSDFQKLLNGTGITSGGIQYYVEDGSIIYLENDIDLTGGLNLQITCFKNFTIDLNGHNMTRTYNSAREAFGNVLDIFSVFGGSNVTIKNSSSTGGKITSCGYQVITVYDYLDEKTDKWASTVTIDGNVTVESTRSENVSNEGSAITIYDCSSVSVQGNAVVKGFVAVSAYDENSNGGSLTVRGNAEVEGTNAMTVSSLTVSGNAKVNSPLSKQPTCNITGGTFSGKTNLTLGSGYNWVDNGDGTYTVMKGICKIGDGETLYENFEKAIAAITDSSGTINLISNATNQNFTVPAGKTITIVPGSYTMSGTATFTASETDSGILKIGENTLTSKSAIKAGFSESGIASVTEFDVGDSFTYNNATYTKDSYVITKTTGTNKIFYLVDNTITDALDANLKEAAYKQASNGNITMSGVATDTTTFFGTNASYDSSKLIAKSTYNSETGTYQLEKIGTGTNTISVNLDSTANKVTTKFETEVKTGATGEYTVNGQSYTAQSELTIKSNSNGTDSTLKSGTVELKNSSVALTGGESLSGTDHDISVTVADGKLSAVDSIASGGEISVKKTNMTADDILAVGENFETVRAVDNSTKYYKIISSADVANKNLGKIEIGDDVKYYENVASAFAWNKNSKEFALSSDGVGKFTFNGVTFEILGDTDKKITFVADNSNNITGITGLDEKATLTITSEDETKLSTSYTVNGQIFSVNESSGGIFVKKGWNDKHSIIVGTAESAKLKPSNFYVTYKTVEEEPEETKTILVVSEFDDGVIVEEIPAEDYGEYIDVSEKTLTIKDDSINVVVNSENITEIKNTSGTLVSNISGLAVKYAEGDLRLVEVSDEKISYLSSVSTSGSLKLASEKTLKVIFDEEKPFTINAAETEGNIIFGETEISLDKAATVANVPNDTVFKISSVLNVGGSEVKISGGDVFVNVIDGDKVAKISGLDDGETLTFDGLKYVSANKNSSLTFTDGELTNFSSDSVITVTPDVTNGLTYKGVNYKGDATSTGGTVILTSDSSGNVDVSLGTKGIITAELSTGSITLDGVTYTGSGENKTVVFKNGFIAGFGDAGTITVTIATTSKNGVKDSDGNIFKASESDATIKFTAGVTAKDSWTSGTVAVTVASGKSITLANETTITASSGTAAITVAEGELSALGTGIVIVTPKDSSNGITIDGVTYTGDGTGTLTFKDGVLSSVGSSNIVYATLTKSSANGITVDNVTYKATDADTQLTFTAGALTSVGSGEVSAIIAEGKTLTYGGITYKESANSTAEVILTSDGTNVKPSFCTGSVVVSASASTETENIEVNNVDFTVSNSDTVILTTADSVTSVAVKSGTVTATFNSSDDKIQIGNVTYTGISTTENKISFTTKDIDGVPLTGGSIQLSKDSASNTYTISDTTVVVGVGSASIVSLGSSASVEIGGVAAEVTVAKSVTNTTSVADLTLNSEVLNIASDKDGYKVAIGEGGTFGEISGISGGAVVSKAAEVSLKTDTTGKFTFGEAEYNIGGDSEVTFLTDDNSNVINIADFTGTLRTAQTATTVNGAAYSISDMDDVSKVEIVADGSGISGIKGLTDGANISGDLDNTAITMSGTSGTDSSVLTINENTLTISGDTDGVVVKGKEITGLANGATLTASTAGTYSVNGSTVEISGSSDIIVGSSTGASKEEPGDAKAIDEVTPENTDELVDNIVGADTYEGKKVEASEVLKEGADLNGTMKMTIDSTTTTSENGIDFSESTGSKNVTTKKAVDLAFNNEGGNVANIQDVTGTTEMKVTLGDGGDVAVIDSNTTAPVNITAGKGEDNIISSGVNVTVDLEAGGKTKVQVAGGTVNLDNYDEKSGAGLQSTELDISAAVESGSIDGTGNTIKIGGGTVNINSKESTSESEEESTSTLVNIYNKKGQISKVGFTNADGGTVGNSTEKASMILKGNYSGDKTGGSQLNGGRGNDNIYAGASDEVNAGGGKNNVTLKQDRTGADEGTTLSVNAEDNGRTTVNNFDRSSDKINFTATNLVYKFVGEVLQLISGRSRLTINGMASDSDLATSSDIGTTNYTDFVQGSGDETVRVAVGGENGVIAVAENVEDMATEYHGTKSGLDFTSFSGEIEVNLDEGTGTFGGESVTIEGINKVLTGDSDAVVNGSEANETIEAGSGNATISGGAGKDVLRGFTGSVEDKTGSAMFVFGTGDGRDVIENFTFLTEDTEDTKDAIDFSGATLQKVSAKNNDVIFDIGDSENLTIKDGVGKNISVNGGAVVQVSDSLTFDGQANYFVGTSGKSTLSVSKDASGVNIWLDNSKDGHYENIRVLDASNYDGNATLVGSAANDTIIASNKEDAGSALMWGNGGNNELIGGSGNDTFVYAATGNDNITNFSEDDTLWLYNCGGFASNGFVVDSDAKTISMTFTNGNTAKVTATGDSVKLQTTGLAGAANGTYTYHFSTQSWS